MVARISVGIIVEFAVWDVVVGGGRSIVVVVGVGGACGVEVGGGRSVVVVVGRSVVVVVVVGGVIIIQEVSNGESASQDYRL